MTYAIEIRTADHVHRSYVAADRNQAEDRALQLANEFGDWTSCAVYEVSLVDALNACVECG